MLSVLLIVVLLISALLAIPVSLAFNISKENKFESEFKLGWLFGLVRVQIPTQEKKPEPSDTKKKEKDKVVKRATRKRKGRSAMHLVFNQQFRQRLFKYTSDIWRSIKKEDIEIYVQAGFDDPANTGQLWGFVGPVAGRLAGIQQHSINIQPNFINQVFEFEGKGELRFSPLKIIGISFGLLLSPSMWRAGYQHLTGH